MHRRTAVVFVVVSVLAAALPAPASQVQPASAARGSAATRGPAGHQEISATKRQLDHDAYEIWKTIEDEAIRNDGRWLLYALTLQDGDPELRVRDTASDRELAVPRGTQARFDAAGRHAVMLIEPELERVRQARRDDVAPGERPKSELGILDLESGALTRIERVQSYELADESGGWVAYLLEEAEAPEQPPADEAEEGPGRQQGDEESESDGEAGTTLVLRELSSGVETRFENVTEYSLSPDGARLAYLTSTADDAGDGAWLVETGESTGRAILAGAGDYLGLTFDERGQQLAFLSDRDDHDSEQPDHSLFYWRAGDAEARLLVAADTDGVADGWRVSEHTEPGFSAAGDRVFLATAPRPAPDPPEDDRLDEEVVRVDIWNWRDPLLQPMQLLQVEQERDRDYRAVVHLDTGRFVQLATLDVPQVRIGSDGDAGVGLGVSNLPYRQEISWDFPEYNDYWAVDVDSGDRRRLRQRWQGQASLSPGGRFAIWWDSRALAWWAMDLRGDPTPIDLTGALPYPVHNEDHDWAYDPQPYGVAGWTADDGELLVYDRFDIWAVDPTGQRAARCITEERGRNAQVRFRYVRLDPEQEVIPASDPLLLSAFDTISKASGFYRDRVEGAAEPERLLWMDKRFSTPRKAEDADALLFTRESVGEFPDLWVSDSGFTDPRKVSDANPQQSAFLWATVDLVEWRSLDGERLQGLLYKPEDFDPERRYPMIVYFYERNSDTLHAHYPPIPHRSVIRPTFYASRGYLVFIPDITYQVGYPGDSALKDVVPGVLELVDSGFVDAGNIGVQGHSWGGYQIAYLVTRTNIFKAAAGGAPVSNMTSAYGGIRWSSGMSRMFQYERTQSRIGATLWQAPIRYIENSPLFWADKVETPLLMMHNDHDGAVPWYQGIEMFVALRRLGKPAWLVNYNDEPHWPTTYANKRDWNVRMQQFFDHYLKGAAAPVWLAEGIPATRKGRTLGLELIEPTQTGAGRSARRQR